MVEGDLGFIRVYLGFGLYRFGFYYDRLFLFNTFSIKVFENVLNILAARLLITI
jgi:hypothetical protein